ncbi:hypothetical protein A2U01_0095180, partial [Trifolium medium]|nr:hypothetical protein [Trifolium medium]
GVKMDGSDGFGLDC